MMKPILIQMAAWFTKFMGNLNISVVLWNVNIFSNMLTNTYGLWFHVSPDSNPIATKFSYSLLVFISLSNTNSNIEYNFPLLSLINQLNNIGVFR